MSNLAKRILIGVCAIGISSLLLVLLAEVIGFPKSTDVSGLYPQSVAAAEAEETDTQSDEAEPSEGTGESTEESAEESATEESTEDAAIRKDLERAISAKGGQIEQAGMSIGVSCGLQGNYRAGAPVPVEISIESEKDFEGLGRIIIPANPDYGLEATAYEKNVLLSAKTRKTVTLSVFSESGNALFYLQMENAKGKILIDTPIRMNNSRGGTNALMGVLSEDYPALQYFDRVTISTNYYDGSIQLLELDTDAVPDQASGLGALSYLLINSYDTSRLSPEQYAAIREWVRQGGVLIVGTGADYKQTLSAFTDDLLSGDVSGMRQGVIEPLRQSADVSATSTETAEPAETVEALAYGDRDGLLDLLLADGDKVDTVFTDSSLVWEKDYGSGRVVLTAFNLGMEPYCSASWIKQTTRTLLESVTEGSAAVHLMNVNYGGNSGYGETTMQGLYQSKRPHAGRIILILALFLVSAPLMYLLLKKLDKREWLWWIMPLTAVVFTAVILIANSDLRITDPIETSITLLTQSKEDPDSMQQSVSLSLLVPSASKTTVPLDGSLSEIYPSRQFSYGFGAEDNKKYKNAIGETADGYLLSITNRETFGSNSFQFVHTPKEAYRGTLTTDYTFHTSGFAGTLTNDTGYDLKGVVVFAGGRAVCLGDMKAGERKSFTEKENQSAGGYDYFSFYSVGKLTEDELLDIRLRDVYDNYLNQSLGMGSYNSLFSGSQSAGGGGYSYMTGSLWSDSGAFTIAYIDDPDLDYVTDKKVEEMTFGGKYVIEGFCNGI